MNDTHPGVDVEDPWQAVEVCFAQEWTDGLPVVPPTAALVEQMLAGGPWPADTVLLQKLGIPAVAVVTEPFAPTAAAVAVLNGMPGYPVVVVPRPFGSLDSRPGVLDQSTQGWAGEYTLCFAEHEAASPWEPLHVSRGFRATQSTVTVFAAESGHNILVHAASEPETLLVPFADAMAGLASLSPGRSVIVLAPEHAQHLTRAGWSRARTQRWLYEHARRPLAHLKRAGKVEEVAVRARADAAVARVERLLLGADEEQSSGRRAATPADAVF